MTRPLRPSHALLSVLSVAALVIGLSVGLARPVATDGPGDAARGGPGAATEDNPEAAEQGEETEKRNEAFAEAKAEGKTLEEEKANAMSVQALKRFVDPKDIAALCIFLASDAGKSISGQVLAIDNGSVKAS